MSRKHGFWGHADEAKKWASRARRRDEKRDVEEQLGARGDESADARITRMLVQGDADTSFSVMVEPEAVSYDFPPHERVLLTFRGPMTTPAFEVAHTRHRTPALGAVLTRARCVARTWQESRRTPSTTSANHRVAGIVAEPR